MKKNINYIIFGATVLMLVVIALMRMYLNSPSKKDDVTNFADCVQANNLVMESYPRQCRTPSGKTFVEPITITPTISIRPLQNAKPDHKQNPMQSPRPTSSNASATAVPKDDLCKNLCGDGICEEIVCMGTGCACAENSVSCPQDCKK